MEREGGGLDRHLPEVTEENYKLPWSGLPMFWYHILTLMEGNSFHVKLLPVSNPSGHH
jgi:hypothetical protein